MKRFFPSAQYVCGCFASTFTLGVLQCAAEGYGVSAMGCATVVLIAAVTASVLRRA